ncbi:archease [Candidatus Bathyarchaeota archaeon]|nr:archease [Candidatus Bathyarchaeota archaeon]
MKKPFRFLEHISDAFIEAYGKTLEEAFENTALAMFEVMTDTKTIDPKISEQVETQAEDEYALLYEWLQLLIVKLEVEDKLYSRFKVESIENTPQGYALKAAISGENYDSEKHPTKTAVKGVTYHDMKITRRKKSVKVRVLLDI